MKLKKKEFTNLRQGSMTVNEYLNSFIQLSRYATEDINTNEKKQDMFLEGLNDDIQFQLFNTDYVDFQHMIDKAIAIESKLKEMEKDGKRKMPFPGQSSGSNVRPRLVVSRLVEMLAANRIQTISTIPTDSRMSPDLPRGMR
jgi:hypothetical protein